MSDANLPAGLAATVLADGASSGTVGDKINKAGMAFGDLIHQVGGAVAATQTKLNEICADTAKTLAKTSIEVVAARQKQYDENGNLTGTANLKMKLPLMAYVDPINHEVASVRIQGVFQATGFDSTSETTDHTGYRSMSGRLHIGAPLSQGPSTSEALAKGSAALAEGATTGYRSGYQSDYETTVGSSYSSETTFGQVRMNAEIRPRSDIGVPKPSQVIRGPVITLVPAAAVEHWSAPASDPSRVLLKRSVVLTATYRRRADGDTPGAAIAGKQLTFETGGLSWFYCDNTGAEATDAAHHVTASGDGSVRIHLERAFPAEPTADRAQKGFVVTARIGMVNASVVVTL